jgi:hypothetical protein
MPEMGFESRITHHEMYYLINQLSDRICEDLMWAGLAQNHAQWRIFFISDEPSDITFGDSFA